MAKTDKISEFLHTAARFQQSESWRKHVWEMDIEDVNFSSLEEKDRTGNTGKALRGMQDAMDGRKFFVVQQFGDEIEADGSIPVSVSLADGKDINASFFSQMADEAQPYGPAMMTEIDSGYHSGVQYLLDVTSLSRKSQLALLRGAETSLEDLSEAASRNMGMGGYSDSYEEGSGYYNRRSDDYESMRENAEYRKEERERYGRALDDDDRSGSVSVESTVQYVLSEAYDSGAKPPYAVMVKAYENVLEALVQQEKEASDELVVASEDNQFGLERNETLKEQGLGSEADKAPEGKTAEPEPEQELEYVSLYAAGIKDEKFMQLDELLESNGLSLMVAQKDGMDCYSIEDAMTGVSWESGKSVRDAAYVAQSFCEDIEAGEKIVADGMPAEDKEAFMDRAKVAAAEIMDVFKIKIDEPEREPGSGVEVVEYTKEMIDERAGKDWQKPIFVKPGLAKPIKDIDGKPYGISIGGFKEQGREMELQVKYKMTEGREDIPVGEKQPVVYTATAMYGRFRGWYMIKPEQKFAVFQLAYKGGHVRPVGIKEAREFVKEKNKELDRIQAAKKQKGANKDAYEAKQ